MKYLIAIMVFVTGEILGLFIFFFIKKKYELIKKDKEGKIKEARIFDIQTFKGILERLVIVTGLIYDFVHIIIAFSALKLGTRLIGEQESHISNDYFLIGNLTSLLLAMIDAIVIRSLW